VSTGPVELSADKATIRAGVTPGRQHAAPGHGRDRAAAAVNPRERPGTLGDCFGSFQEEIERGEPSGDRSDSRGYNA
jgi:hypothetical protein